MLMEAGLLSDVYPIRMVDDPSASRRHSLRLRKSDRARVDRLFAARLKDIEDEGGAALLRRGRGTPWHRDGPAFAAHEFARFAAALKPDGDAPVSAPQVNAAYTLLRRRVDMLPQRYDRVIAAGLAATALVAAGSRVHVITDSEAGTNHAGRRLLTVFERLGIHAAGIRTGDDEAARAAAYRADVTVLAARELAMDFLRDAVHWPGRVNPAQQHVDRLLGSRSRRRSILMRGLPCAIHIDIDSALIDNARTPIVLTRDAHPMHEAEELKRALDLAARLEHGVHYQLTGEGREVVFTGAGTRQIDAWREQLEGLWNARHVAELLLSAAIVAGSVLKKEIHYRIDNGAVVWLVQDRLVPGVEYYSKSFIARMVETMEQCPATSQREEVARASYQQVFNRYVHLCGLCHSLDGITGELRRVYGLGPGNRPARTPPLGFSAVALASTQLEKVERVVDWASRGDGSTFSMVVVSDGEMLTRIEQALDGSPGLRVLRELPAAGGSLGDILSPGMLLLAPAPVLDYLQAREPDLLHCPVRIMVAGRGASATADRRHLRWMEAAPFAGSETVLLLAADDELFSDSSIGAFKPALDRLGPRMRALALNRWIARIQARRGREMEKMRRNLLTHETNMQGLLSFSGRGVYE